MIHLQDINKTYQGAQPLHVLKGISLDIAKGEFVSIMGASGSGKSTLLNILGILDNYDSGVYELAGTPIWNLSERKAAEYRNKMIGFIFQSFNLISFKTAVENVELPLFYQGVSNSFLFTSSLIAVANHVNAGEGAHSIMHTNYSLCIVRNLCEAVLYRMEACFASICQLVVYVESVFLAKFLPIVLLCLGQDEDNLQGRRVLAKPFKGSHQYRFSTNRQKLFGNIAPHSQAFTPCYYDDIIHQAIKCLKRMPSAIWSEVFLSTN